MPSSAKNDLSTQIPQNLIDEAVDAVEEHKKPQAEAPPAGEAPADEIEPLKNKLKEKETELELSQQLARDTMNRLKETHERMLRAAADLENYKKRAVRERDEVTKFGIETLLKDLLPVVDNLDRALEHARKSQKFDDLLKGVELTRKAFEDTLAKRGVKSFSAKGEPFDPAKHEALQQVESAEVPPGTVIQEIVRGYTLHDRLVRPAAVVVSRAPATAAAPATDTEPAPGEGVAEKEGEKSST